MGDHIIPRVLLRGFVTKMTKNRDDARLIVLTPEGIINGKNKNLYQEADFYPKEVEEILNHKYEQPFGLLKKRLVEELNDSKANTFTMSKSEYINLVMFIIIMWRRNDVQLEKMDMISRKILNNSYLRTMMKDEFKNISTEELIESKKKEMQSTVFKFAIENTTENDPTVQKNIKDYIPKIIVNHSNINFPLHCKYSTSMYLSLKREEEYPDFNMEPITNRVFVIFLKSKEHGKFVEDTFNVDVIHIDSDEEAKMFINIYIIGSAKSYVVDKTNLDIVEKRLRFP